MRHAPPETLPKRSDFLNAAARGRKFARPGFVVQVVQTSPQAPLRIGFTASRKVGNAVHRNRARRRLRALLRLALDQRTLAGADIVMIARKDTGEIAFDRMRAEFGAVLDQCFPAAAADHTP